MHWLKRKCPKGSHGQLRTAPGRQVAAKTARQYIVRFCFRDNTILEQLHAAPDSRISQAEMRTLMMGAVQNCYNAIGFLLNVYDTRPGLRTLMEATIVFAGFAAGNTTAPSMNLLDALEACDFNPEWNEPDDGEERLRRQPQKPGRKKKKPRLS